jgi:hypothetical protein
VAGLQVLWLIIGNIVDKSEGELKIFDFLVGFLWLSEVLNTLVKCTVRQKQMVPAGLTGLYRIIQ